ncbi:MAG TPA: hypothetical protein VF762_15695, partial [Blastocatellia bacterium]
MSNNTRKEIRGQRPRGGRHEAQASRQGAAAGIRPWVIMLSFIFCLLICAAPASQVSASDPGSGDWPMWGGTPDRNMISSMKGMPTSWDVAKKKNIKWVAELGSQT